MVLEIIVITIVAVIAVLFAPAILALIIGFLAQRKTKIQEHTEMDLGRPTASR